MFLDAQIEVNEPPREFLMRMITVAQSKRLETKLVVENQNLWDKTITNYTEKLGKEFNESTALLQIQRWLDVLDTIWFIDNIGYLKHNGHIEDDRLSHWCGLNVVNDEFHWEAPNIAEEEIP